MNFVNLWLDLTILALIIVTGLCVWYGYLAKSWESAYWEELEQSQKERLAYGSKMFHEGLEQGRKLGDANITKKLENDEV